MRGRGGGGKKSGGATEWLPDPDAGDGFPRNRVERAEAEVADSEAGYVELSI